ncbi:MAG TPA: pitrilysin family protein [Syntrophobacteria bacterium]|nr:pitrilysin family protein [Syntrophobacteria bacterium]
MGKWRSLLVIISVLIVTGAAFGQGRDLPVPPLETLGLSPESLDRVTALVPSRPGDTFLQLRNGMTVLVRENHSSRVVSCQLLVRTGSIHEGNHLFGGLSHYLEHVVAGGSTRSFSEQEARELVRGMGGAANAYTTYDRTVYYVNTTSERYGQALQLLLAYASQALLEPGEVAREKAVIQQEYKLGETDSGRELWRLFLATAYRRHPIRHPVIGYEDVFVTVSRDDLLDYYRKRYAPQHLVLTVVGDVNGTDAVRRVLELTADMPRTFDPPTIVEEEPPQVTPRWVEKSFPPARLTTMTVGVPSVTLTHPDLYALDVLAIILGKGRSSRLYAQLKDRQELVLSVDAFSWTPAFVPGIFGFSFSLERDRVDATLASLWREVERIQGRLVETDELEKGKGQIVADSVRSRESMAQMASSLAGAFVDTGDPYFDDSYVERIQTVSREDVRRVARAYLKKDVSTVAILSPPRAEARETAQGEAPGGGEVRLITLDNGLKLLVKRNPALPLVEFRVSGLGGQYVEPEELAGIGSFTMALLTKGTAKRSKQEIAETIEQLGGSLASGSGRNTYYVSLSILKKDTDTGLELLADVLTNPSFPEAEIEKQRQDTLLAIRRADENWEHEVDRLFRRNFYGSHPYGKDILGSAESVRRIRREEIRDFYRGTVLPTNAVLAVFGDIDPETIVSKISTILGAWRGSRPVLKAGGGPVEPLRDARRIEEKTAKVSAGIFLGTGGVSVNDPERPVLDVIDAVLSGINYPSGWLHEALRGGDRSLVYVVHGFPSYGIGVGHFGIVAQTTMSNYQEVVRIILEKLQRIQQQPLEAGELEVAKNMCITMHEMGLETNAGQAASATINEVLGLGYDWDRRYPEQIRQVQAEDVLRVARRLFQHHLLVSAIPERPVEAVIPPEQRDRMHVK